MPTLLIRFDDNIQFFHGFRRISNWMTTIEDFSPETVLKTKNGQDLNAK